MPIWFKRSFYNVWRKPFRTGLVILFLALVVGLFTVMATVNRLAAGQFAALEGALVSTIDVRPAGSLGLGGVRSRPLPFALVDEIREMEPGLRVDPYLIRREFEGETTTFYVGLLPGSPLMAVGDPEPMERRIIAGRTFISDDRDTPMAVIGLEVARRFDIEVQQLEPSTNISVRGQDWRVIGIFDGGSGFTNGQLFLSLAEMREAFKAQGLSRILVQAPSVVQGASIAKQLTEQLAGQADVVTNRSAVILAQAALAGIGGATRTGAFVFFIAGALVVMGAMVLTFRDQQRE
ncbi:MAG: ABC transporter permease, partial [Proteobacteria bacterium]|nr:ABC transporter permease [Pseudomonadota bacterium]